MFSVTVVCKQICWLRALAGIAFALLCCSTHAEERLSRLFSDHMVMQRGMPVPVWGWVEPGETITVSIDRQTKVARADESGKWMVRLDPMEVGTPRKMTVKGRAETVEVNDILLGEVWLASGQSNMALQLWEARNGKQEVADSNHPEIRLFNVPNAVAPRAPNERLPAGNPQIKNMNVWQASSPATSSRFSAVAYFFARDLHRSLRVPIGIIANSFGATPIEAWISREAYMADPDFKAVAEYYDGLTNYVENTPEGKKELADVSAQYDARQAQLRASGKRIMWPARYVGPVETWHRASTVFNAVVNPLVPFAVRGVIWYQGEAQSNRMEDYRGLLPLLVKDWRNRWGQGNFPFVYVQLPNFLAVNPNPDHGGWAFLREAQLLALQLPKTAMAVTIELGEAANIHPLNKQDVGSRLALAARGVAYGEKIVHSGPIYRSMQIDGSVIRLSFDHVGSGLMVGRKSELEPVVEDKGAMLKRFAIAGKDLKFVWADAAIEGDTVMVSASSVTKPVAVRYAWASNPEGSNLYNREGLPASPFRTDPIKPAVMAAAYKSRIKNGFTLKPLR